MTESVATPTGVTGAADITPAVPEAIVPESTNVRKVKVNGREVEIDSERAWLLATKGLAADEKFETAAKLRKEADEMVSPLKQKKVIDALMKQGFSREEAREAIEDELVRIIEEESMSPVERERLAKEARLREYEEKEENETKTAAQKAREAEVHKELERIEDDIIGAFEKSSLPREPFLAKRVGSVMHSAALQGVDISAVDAVKYIESQYKSEMKQVLSKMDAQTLREFVGKENVSKLRDADVAAIKQAEKPFAKSPKENASTAPKVSDKASQKKVQARFFDEVRGIRR